MAIGSTLYRVTMELSDVTRGVYESLQFRIACHPSEDTERVVTRILAYGLLFEEGLEFGKGVSSDEPALWAHDLTGRLTHWVDIGTPGADRIHQASKQTDRVTVFCHRSEDALAREMQRRKVHRAEIIDVFLLEPSFIVELAGSLDRDSRWTLVHADGDLSISLDDRPFSGSVRKVPLPQ